MAGDGESCSIKPSAQSNVRAFFFCLQAAADGLGAAIGPYPLVMDDLQSGRLVAPFGFVPSGHDYVLLGLPEESSPLVTAFEQWLTKRISACVPEQASIQ